MDSEDDLDSFRSKWKVEIQQSLQRTKEEKGKALYHRGIELERRGYCYEAIEFYRQACKLVPDIDQRLDVTLYSDSRNSTSNEDEYGFDDEHDGTLGDTLEIVEMLDELSFEEDTCAPHYPQKASHISVLPAEVLLLIARYIVSHQLDFKSLENFSMACRWFYRLARTPALWRAACQRLWPDQHPQLIHRYGSWRLMYINNPHLRFDGIYISRIKYFRQGEPTPSLCCTWQTVVYHRFFRFFADGFVTAVNTTLPPQHCVTLLKERSPPAKDGMRLMCGRYKVMGNVVRMTLRYRDIPLSAGTSSSVVRGNGSQTTTQSFNIVMDMSAKQGRQVLTWKEYTIVSENLRSGAQTQDIDLVPPHFCKFIFGRVKSYAALSSGKL